VDVTHEEADLINLQNDDDRIELLRRGVDERKIVVLPLGLSRDRLAQFASRPPPVPSEPRIAFVGTFDARKGGREFPEIVRLITHELPKAKLRMLGARYLTSDQVVGHFPRQLRPHLEVVPSYEPDQLPQLLSDCSLGVFPSYLEGFPFAVLEMLAASLPVIAYRAPGAPMMLPDAWLAPLGDFRGLSRMALALVTSSENLVAARQWARRRAEEFPWDDAARRTSHAYAQHLENLRRRAG
jgi:glycosyltransferase involved in cell wall biosynthesis